MENFDQGTNIVCSSFILILLALATVSNPAFASTHCPFPAIFNFGDSNSDTGGLSAAFGPAPPPNGETFFNKPSGRYSDGRLIIDFIAKSFGLPYLNAYLDSVGSNFTHGTNFATAASTIRAQNYTLRQGFSPFSLDVQTWQFNQFKSRSALVFQRGEVFKKLMPKQEYFSQALYTFDIGQNDITAGYFLNKSTEEVIASMSDVLYKFNIGIKDVYWQGGRYFWIHNTGPVGCLPYILDKLPITAGQLDRAGCATPYNEVCKYFNKNLKETVVQLRKDLPEAAFTYVDIYSVKYNLISQARKHGFVHPLRACCGHGGKYNYNKEVGCGGSKNVNGTQVLVGHPCKDPSVAINWDGVHYTEAANKWVFDRIVDGAFSDPPSPLRMACHREAP